MPPRRRQVELDEALESVGGYGKFQFFMFAMLFPVAMFQGAKMTANYFLLYKQKYRCRIPSLGSNDSYNGLDHQLEINETIPTGESCYMYDPHRIYKYNEYNQPINGTQISCTEGYVFDKHDMELTATSELHFVCEDAIYTSHTTLLLFLGSLVGSAGLGYLADKIGRKKCLLLTVLLYLVSGIVMIWSPDFAALGIFQFIGGAAATGMSANAFVMGLELVSPSHRRIPGLVYIAFFPLGEIIVGGVAYGLRNWRWLELVITLPSVIFLSYYWLLPESIRWLMVRKRWDEVGEILHRVAKWNGTGLPRNASSGDEMAGLLQSFQADNDDNPAQGEIVALVVRTDSFWHLFTSRVLSLRFFVVSFNWLMSMMVFYGFVYNADKLTAGNIYLNFILGAIVELPAQVVTVNLVDRIGRKALHCGLLVVAMLASVAAIVVIYEAGHDDQWVVVMLSCIGKFAAAGLMGTSFLWTTELFPTTVRSTGLGISNAFGRVGAIGATYLVSESPRLGGHLGQALPFVVFCGASLLTMILCLLLPETFKRKLPETIAEAEVFGRSDDGLIPQARASPNYGTYKQINGAT